MKVKNVISVLFGLILVLPFAASAGSPEEEKSVEPNRMVLDVDGIVCSFCSYGLQKKLKGMEYVDSSEFTDGVFVDIEKQQVTLALKPGAEVDVQKAFEAIRKGGYEPIRAVVTDSKGEESWVEAEKG